MTKEKRRYFINLTIFAGLIFGSTVMGWGIATFLAGLLMVLAFGFVLVAVYFAADDEWARKTNFTGERHMAPIWKHLYDMVILGALILSGHIGLATIWALTYGMSLYVLYRSRKAKRIVSYK